MPGTPERWTAHCREALGDVVGAGFSFLLEVEKPNEPVDVACPGR